MGFKAEDNLMEMIWDAMPRYPDENHITLGAGDIEELYNNGFVDTELYKREDWVKAFEPHKTAEEDTYVVTKEEFLEKEKFRYKGEIMVPFEPLLINEGKYTDEGLQELIDLSIAPSCSLPKRDVQKFFDEFKAKYREKDNLIRMDMEGKRRVAYLIYENPSPMRRRELLFDAMFAMHMQEIVRGKSQILKATPEQAAQVQVSTFTTLPSSRSEAAAKELERIEKVRGAKATGSGDEGVQVKKVRKSRKGFRG